VVRALGVRGGRVVVGGLLVAGLLVGGAVAQEGGEVRGGEPVEQGTQRLVVGAAAGGERVVGAVGLGHHGLVGEVGGEQGVQDAAEELLGALGAFEPGVQVLAAAVGSA